MAAQQDYTEYVPPNGNPYDFITNPPPPPKRSLFSGGDSMLGRVLVVAVGLFILMIIAAVVLSITRGGNDTADSMKRLVQQQQEIARVANIGTRQGNDIAVRNFATTTELTIVSDQMQLTNYLKQHRQAVEEKQLGLLRSSETDKILADAEQTSTFDSAFQTVMETELTEYANNIRTTYNSVSNAETRTLLDQQYTNAAQLIEQLEE